MDGHVSPRQFVLARQESPLREPARPEVSLCRECFCGALEMELAVYPGRMIAFEPDGASVTQYFFVAAPDFDDAGLQSGVSGAITGRLSRASGSCKTCSRYATWQWISREEVGSLDDVGNITAAVGEPFCSEHGAKHLCAALASIAQVNLFYVNAPYGEGGAYLWI